MPRLRDMTPRATVEHRRAWWCHRHGWWLDDEQGCMLDKPECGIAPCGGRPMLGPYTVEVRFSPVATEERTDG